MLYQKNKKKKLLILDLLYNNFKNIQTDLKKENLNLKNVHKQINTGKKTLIKINPLKGLRATNIRFNSINNYKDKNKKKEINISDDNDFDEKTVNRLNINNYKIYNLPDYTTEENDKSYKNNISNSIENSNVIIKSILKKLSIEDKNKAIQEKLKSIQLHDCNKRKKIKLKPLQINQNLHNNSLSHSNKYIFPKNNIFDNKKENNNTNNNLNENLENNLNNQNITNYSNLFRNTAVSVIKKRNEEKNRKEFLSPCLGRNMKDEFKTIDDEENESIEQSIIIKEGINKINNNNYYRPLFYSERRNKNIYNENINRVDRENKNYYLNDITKIRNIKDIERKLFKNKNKTLFERIKLKDIKDSKINNEEESNNSKSDEY